MKLIVGLGNPGKKYDGTRHNFGFMVVDAVAGDGVWKKFGEESLICLPSGHDQCLIKPQSFMNESGASVAAVKSFYKIELDDIWVVHDDLDLPSGAVRISFDSSSAGHRGVQSIIDALGSQKFHRLRLGIGRTPGAIPAEAYVLQPFTAEEQKQLDGTIKLAWQTLSEALTKPN